MLDGLLPQSAAAFALASLLIELTPGPNMTWLVLVAAEEGRRKAFPAVGGVALGLAIVGAISAVGVAEIVRSSTMAYEALRWAGIAFLLWLAFDAWRGTGGEEAGEGRNYFLRGLMSNLLNPKAFIFYVSVLPTFVNPAGSLFQETLSLTAIYVAIATAVHAGLVIAAGALRPVLTRPKIERIVRRALAAVLALVAIWFAFSTAR
ncbi:LysE family translocator [Rhizobium sp. C4]|uniref:LysE family translocator n=1 Tax=Rhizobium sp. C4 TaxID=1349800 RepID=UPI001E2F8E67|nr:LysE family translocator [Rhizobium sp. C4]MCD2175542.1 LysE family translocator [Rhizobium sp. C4]